VRSGFASGIARKQRDRALKATPFSPEMLYALVLVALSDAEAITLRLEML
jgi:hypothetical protein